MNKLLIHCFLFTSLTVFGQNNFWKPIDKEFDLKIAELEDLKLNQNNKKKEKEIVERLLFMAKNYANPVMKSRAIQFDVASNYYSNPDSAIYQLDQAIHLIDTVKYKYDYYKILSQKEIVYRTQGNYLKSYKTLVKILPYFQKIGDEISIAQILSRLGTVMESLKEYQKAEEYLKNSSAIYDKLGYNKLSFRNRLNLSNVFYRNNKKKEAVEMLENLLSYPVISDDDEFKINLLLSLYSFSTDGPKREEYVKESYQLAKKSNNLHLLGKTSGNLVDFYRNKNDYDSAMLFYNEAYPLFKKFNDIGSLRILFANKYLMFADRNKWDSAFHYSQMYHHYNDSIMGIDKALEVNRIEALTAIQSIEQEKKEAEQQRKITLAILFGVCCLSLAIISTIYFRNKKIKIQKQLKETENKELNERLKNEVLLKENLKLEIDSKNRELTSNTLLLTEKNKVLENLARQIKEMEYNGQLAAKEEKELQKQINDHLQASDEWEYFKIHFESVHPKFFSKLKEHSVSISENDLRLCAYIRIGMETKQIAQMLSVLPATINTSRYRIRKKLNIAGDISLEDFLRSL